VNKELPTQVVAVFVFIQQEGKTLLVRQNYGRRYWSLPGGVVERGETLQYAAIREVREETGLDITIKRVVGVYSKPEENALAITLEGEISGGELKPDNEISECGYYSNDQLPVPIREHFTQRLDDFRNPDDDVVLRTQ
jgi:ADP-ribose pyrophosphatase YjhB (NUDIX family)